jgi:hypothetical protein
MAALEMAEWIRLGTAEATRLGTAEAAGLRMRDWGQLGRLGAVETPGGLASLLGSTSLVSHVI